jgi:hypothetical protein
LTRQDKTNPAGLGETNNFFSLALGQVGVKLVHCRVSFILPCQLILLAFLVETNIFEASHVTFFSTN